MPPPQVRDQGGAGQAGPWGHAAVPECAASVCRDAARFVTKAELGKLGLGHLVGTPLFQSVQ